MQRCTHCGKEIQDNVTLCPYCLNGAGGSHQNDLAQDWAPRREDGSTPMRKGGPQPGPAQRSGLPIRTIGIAGAVIVCVILAALFVASLQHPVQESPDLAIFGGVLQQYHTAHPSNNTSLEETGQEAIELVGLLGAKGVAAHVQAGALEGQISTRDEVNRAWVLAAVNNSTKRADGTIANTTAWLAGDPSSGAVVAYDQNRYYYTGLSFNNTTAFRDFLDARKDHLAAQEEYSRASAAFQDLQQQSKETKDYQEKVKLDYQISTQAAVVSRQYDLINETATRFWSVPVQ
ncbi:zinc-ribbon domain-containing protein [Methanosphaerula subterraneus]|uniref:zinc-ribbon domain-containing protein n=1 Tax=Methanosphaerula subterraneus TaxID=3350244 RepID=UPI003F87DC02